ncbi:MAG: CBS domain-containing protein, partial [Bacteroidota bacterium]
MITSEKEFLLLNGLVFLLLLFLLARLLTATYGIRKSEIITAESEPQLSWSFKNRITVQFFVDVFLSCLLVIFLFTPVIHNWCVFAAILGILFVLLLIPGRFNADAQRFFNKISLPLHRLNAFVNDAPYNARENKVKELEQVLENSESESPEADERTLRGIVRFTEIHVEQIMTHASQVIAVNDTYTLSEILQTVRENRYSRMPVFNSRTQRVIGILHAKDLLNFLDRETADWRPLLRPAFFVSGRRMVMDVL